VSDKSKKIEQLTPEQKKKLLEKLRTKGVRNLNTLNKKESEKKEFVFEQGKSYALKFSNPFNFSKTEFIQHEIDEPLPNMVQIKAEAASLNFRDLMIAMGMYPQTPETPSVMGSDFAGVVSKVGANVSKVKIGERVMAISLGSFKKDATIDPNSHFCNYMNVQEQQVFRMPENLSFIEAASIPTVFSTAYYALFNIARLQEKETILIHSATGGLGLASIALAKIKRCRIFATAGNEQKRELLHSMGIDLVMNSRTSNFAKEILDFTHGEGVDVVMNTLSGNSMLAGISTLNYFGRFLQIDKKDIAANNSIPLANFNKGLSYSAIDLGLLLRKHHLVDDIFKDISRLFEEGRLQLPQIKVFSAKETHQALNLMSRSAHIGKLVIDYAR
jgi:NADPH:quinone reductase-like Zn-dependent oxidoreductase